MTYTFGLANAVSLHVETFGSGKIDDGEIADRVQQHFEFRLAGILRAYRLTRPTRGGDGRYRGLAPYVRMRRPELELPWERTDTAEALV